MKNSFSKRRKSSTFSRQLECLLMEKSNGAEKKYASIQSEQCVRRNLEILKSIFFKVYASWIKINLKKLLHSEIGYCKDACEEKL